MRDMSLNQFLDALERHGMKFEGFMGYVNLNVPGKHICASVINAGPNRRDRLAYLLQQRDRYIEEQETKAGAAEETASV